MTRPAPFTRPRFAAGDLLRAEDLDLEASFLVDRERLANASLHTWGVARGLEVTATADARGAKVAPGFALDADGREVVLAKARTFPLDTRYAGALLLVIAYRETAADPLADAQGWYPRRVVVDSALRWCFEPEAGDVVLARVEVTSALQISRIDPSVRRDLGLTVGSLAFLAPQVLAARMGADTKGTLQVEAAQIHLMTPVSVTGALGIGLDAPAAALEVAAPSEAVESGTVTLVADRALGHDVDLGRLVRVGDRIRVGKQVATVASLDSAQGVGLAPRPPAPQVTGPFTVEPGPLLRARLGDGTPALVVTDGGALGLGTETPASTLELESGDLRLTTPQVAMPGGGLLQDRVDAPARTAVALEPKDKDGGIAITTPLAVTFTPGAPAAPAPAMVAVPEGRVGIGTQTPPDPLTVDGIITADALIFKDGTVQAQGVVPLPIGTVVDWWRPASGLLQPPEGFQLCNGATVTDPASPLKGVTLPNLQDRFVRGVVDLEDVGGTGGAETHSHGYTLADHDHPMPHVHRLTGILNPTHQTSGTDMFGSSLATAGHGHSYESTSAGPSPSTTGQYRGGAKAESQGASNVPRFTYLLKLMRIK